MMRVGTRSTAHVQRTTLWHWLPPGDPARAARLVQHLYPLDPLTGPIPVICSCQHLAIIVIRADTFCLMEA